MHEVGTLSVKDRLHILGRGRIPDCPFDIFQSPFPILQIMIVDRVRHDLVPVCTEHGYVGLERQVFPTSVAIIIVAQQDFHQRGDQSKWDKKQSLPCRIQTQNATTGN